jgi:type VI secretion system secreted protein Hcp
MAGYLKIGDIKGESVDADHKDWINIVSISQGMNRHVPEGKSGHQRQRGSVTCGDVVCTKEMDASSPKLIQAVCDGKVFDTVKVDVCVSTGADKRVPYFQWEMKNVIVSDYSLSGQGGEDGQFFETLSLNYEEIKWTYDKMGKDGKSKGKIDATWKVEEGKA